MAHSYRVLLRRGVHNINFHTAIPMFWVLTWRLRLQKKSWTSWTWHEKGLGFYQHDPACVIQFWGILSGLPSFKFWGLRNPWPCSILPSWELSFQSILKVTAKSSFPMWLHAPFPHTRSRLPEPAKSQEAKPPRQRRQAKAASKAKAKPKAQPKRAAKTANNSEWSFQQLLWIYIFGLAAAPSYRLM